MHSKRISSYRSNTVLHLAALAFIITTTAFFVNSVPILSLDRSAWSIAWWMLFLAVCITVNTGGAAYNAMRWHEEIAAAATSTASAAQVTQEEEKETTA